MISSEKELGINFDFDEISDFASEKAQKINF